MQYRWVMREADDDAVARVRRELNDLPEALARALVLRGVDSLDVAKRYFRPSIEQLHEPLLMQDMAMATERLSRAIEQGERVMVYGDYDVDGTTATALMVGFLRAQGTPVSYFIPDRIKDGYGLGPAGIDKAAEEGASLMIALDCGITAHKQATYAREKGIDLIICDHHTAHDTVPEAVAVLDPKRKNCPYPFKELSGCGVGFKLVQAVMRNLGYPPEDAHVFLDLMALSIASDIVPMHGENRVLMREGLEVMKERARPGIRALAKVADLDLKESSTSRIVFSIGPRINAAGRLGSAARAVELMLATDENKAEQIAKILEKVNQERRLVDRETQREAAQQAERQITATVRHGLVLHQADWHPGVIGIVASRMVERFYKPTVMLCTVNGVVKGSARSIAGINIYDVLEGCSDLLTQFGGHDYAAGMTLEEQNIPAFRERFNELVGERMTAELSRPALEVDADLDLNDLSSRFWAVLRQFAPYGPGNIAPVFRATDLAVVGAPRTVGKEGRHLKFRVRQQADPQGEVPIDSNGHVNGRSIDVIGFGLGDRIKLLQESRGQRRPLELLFTIEDNTFRGRTSLQLKAKDLRIAS